MRALGLHTPAVRLNTTCSAGLVGGLIVMLLTLLSAAPLLIGGTVVGQDTAAFFTPMYAFLGDRLRAGELPVWNPYQFAGAPFLADPESGWLYWPAMLLFTLFPVTAAVRLYLLLHLLLAALATYLIGRLIGLSVAGAVVAAGAYELSGVVYGRAVCCPAYIQLAAWLPVAMIGTELALRAGDWPRRLGWCWLSAFAVSQILASWLGQGSYYALLVIGGYVVYRAAEQAVASRRWTATVRPLAAGCLIVAFGVWLAAAAILPRFEFRAASSLAHGYGGALAWAAELGGWGWGDFDNRLLAPGLTFMGGGVAICALLGILAARWRYRAPFFAAMAVGILMLSTAWENPLQWLLTRLLPEFGELHHHWPERAMVVFPLATAMLAGIFVAVLPTLRQIRQAVTLLSLLLPLVLLIAGFVGADVHPIAIAGMAVVAGAVVLAPRVTHPTARRGLPGVVGVILMLELLLSGLLATRDAPYGGFHRLDLDTYLAQDGAAAFLDEQRTGVPSRFFGYNPVFREIEAEHGEVTYYRYHFAEPGTRALLVNNLGTHFALADVQGYNPLQLQHYVDFMRVLNGVSQEYHGAWVLPTGLDSPLVDLLGVRYVVIPAVAPPDRTEIERLARSWPVVYRDADVRVLENPGAFPRAWLVHGVVPGDADTLAKGIADGSLDLRTEAVVDSAVPNLGPSPDPSAESVTVTHYSPNAMSVQVTADAPALLVTSEVDYPAWQAYVDDKPVETVRANVAFRAIAVSPGTHTVEFRYESTALNAGLLLSGIGYLGAFTMAGLVVKGRLRQSPRVR